MAKPHMNADNNVPQADVGRIHALDGLRGVASVMVLLLHTATMLNVFDLGSMYSLIPGTPAVIIFFVLSGVVLALGPLKHLREGRPYDWVAYYPRRIVRLCIPLFAAIALGVLAGYAAWTIGSTGRSASAIDFNGGIARIVHDVLMQFDVFFNISDDMQTIFGTPLTRVNSPVWSMSWELWFSLTLPLVIALLACLRHERATVFALFVGILTSYWCGYFPLRFVLMFWLGVVLARRIGDLSRIKLAPTVELLCAIIAFAIIELVQANVAGLLGPMSPFASACLSTLMNAACMLLVVLAIIDGTTRRILSTRIARFLGTISFSLYLTHSIVIGGLEALLPRVGIAMPTIQAGIALVMCFAFASAFWWAVERPSIDFSRRVGEALSEKKLSEQLREAKELR